MHDRKDVIRVNQSLCSSNHTLLSPRHDKSYIKAKLHTVPSFHEHSGELGMSARTPEDLIELAHLPPSCRFKGLNLNWILLEYQSRKLNYKEGAIRIVKYVGMVLKAHSSIEYIQLGEKAFDRSTIAREILNFKILRYRKVHEQIELQQNRDRAKSYERMDKRFAAQCNVENEDEKELEGESVFLSTTDDLFHNRPACAEDYAFSAGSDEGYNIDLDKKGFGPEDKLSLEKTLLQKKLPPLVLPKIPSAEPKSIAIEVASYHLDKRVTLERSPAMFFGATPRLKLPVIRADKKMEKRRS